MGAEYCAVIPHRLVLRGRGAPFIDVPERLNLEEKAVIRQAGIAKTPPQKRLGCARKSIVNLLKNPMNLSIFMGIIKNF